MPFRLVRHVWKAAQDGKARAFRKDINTLVMKLSDILRADFVRSEEGLSAERLEASVGATHQSIFDFAVMSRMLAETSAKASLPETRRRRIRWLLSALKSQRFYPPVGDGDKRIGAAEPYRFEFDNCADAVAAYRERLANMIEVAKAIAIAKLEIEGSYNEFEARRLFRRIRRQRPRPAGRGPLPGLSRLACAPPTKDAGRRRLDLARPRRGPAGQGSGSDRRSRRAVAARRRDRSCSARAASSSSARRSAWGRSTSCSRRAPTCSSSASGFFPRWPMRDRRCSAFFPAPTASAVGLPPYLTAAAAMEARAFPALSYDPSAGPDWASRFSLRGQSAARSRLAGPQPRLRGRGAPAQMRGPRLHARRFRRLRSALRQTFRQGAAGEMERQHGVGRRVRGVRTDGPSTTAPCLLTVDREDRLQKLIVDDKMIREARRCVGMWRSLQELGGIHNSHAARAVEQERKIWARGAASRDRAAGGRARRRGRNAARGRRPRRRRPRRPRRRPRGRRTIPTSRRRDAPPATSAPRSTTRCSATTPTSRPRSSTRTPGPIGSSSRPRKAARSRSFIPASRAIPTSRGSRSCWRAPNPSSKPADFGCGERSSARGGRKDG